MDKVGEDVSSEMSSGRHLAIFSVTRWKVLRSYVVEMR